MFQTYCACLETKTVIFYLLFVSLKIIGVQNQKQGYTLQLKTVAPCYLLASEFAAQQWLRRKNSKATADMDKTVSNKIKPLLGSRITFAITGGARLPPETQESTRVYLAGPSYWGTAWHRALHGDGHRLWGWGRGGRCEVPSWTGGCSITRWASLPSS